MTRRPQTTDGGRGMIDRKRRTTDDGRWMTVRGLPSAVKFWLLFLALTLPACASASSEQLPVDSGQWTVTGEQSAISHLTISPTLPSSPTPLPSNTPTPLPPTPTPLPCTDEFCIHAGHFILQRPIAAELVDIVDSTYRYGNTANGLRKTHHGVEFVNPQGTPVLAAADGMVIIAGTDYQEPLADFPAFYGNVVVIEHTFPDTQLPDDLRPVYTLYGHLSEVRAEVGQTVHAGDTVGLVGFTGAAIGEHLHFEVRQGENAYNSTRNPELWLAPHLDENQLPTGALAGRVVDEYGNSIYIPTVTIEQFDPASGDTLKVYYLESYADWTVNGDNEWGEAFALGDIPAGQYRVSFVARGLQTYEIEVLPGLVTVITFDAGKTGD